MSNANEKYDYDYFVIGGGSGGVRSSRIAAQHGARVALAEAKKLGKHFKCKISVFFTINFLGGTCVNVGCVPKKLFCYASQFRELFHDAHSYGWPKIDMKLEDHNWKKFLENKNAEIQRLNEAYEKTQKDNHVNIIKGFASLKDQHTVVVNEKEYTTKYILLAVGG
jgi:glutathione reductase (NADPH)